MQDAEEGEEYEDEEDEDEDIQMARDDADVPFSQEELRENFPPVVQIEDSGLKVHQLAKAFYDDPSSAMTTIGVAGRVPQPQPISLQLCHFPTSLFPSLAGRARQPQLDIQ